MSESEAKRHVLSICNTYYQLLVAIQLRRTRFVDDDFTAILSDYSKDAKKVVENLRRDGIFTHVVYAEIKGIDSTKKILKTAVAAKFLLGLYRREIFNEDLPVADIFLFYNYSTSTEIIYYYLVLNNKNLRCFRFEEGVPSYTKELPIALEAGLNRLINLRLKHLDIGSLGEKTKSIYCFFPEIYKGRLEPIPLESFHSNDADFKALLQRIFSFKYSEINYDRRYIYFSGCIDSDHSLSVEFNLFEKFADLVGKENIIVKIHPRDTRTVYQDNGYMVDKNSSIPWEAVQIGLDFSDKVLVSTFSQSAISSNILTEKGVETYYLYKLCKNEIPEVKESKRMLNETIEIFHNAGQLSRVKVVNTLDEILS